MGIGNIFREKYGGENSLPESITMKTFQMPLRIEGDYAPKQNAYLYLKRFLDENAIMVKENGGISYYGNKGKIILIPSLLSVHKVDSVCFKESKLNKILQEKINHLENLD